MSLSAVDQSVWGTVEGQATAVASKSSQFKAEAEDAKNKFLATKEIGEHLVSNVEGRSRWLDLLYVINHSLPDTDAKGNKLGLREQLHITNIDCQQVDDLSKWFTVMTHTWYEPPMAEDGQVVGDAKGAAAGAAPAAAPPAPAAGPAMPGAARSTRRARGRRGSGGRWRTAGTRRSPDAWRPWGTRCSRGARAPGCARRTSGRTHAHGRRGAPMGAAPGPGAAPASGEAGPTGPGFVIQLKGKHYHNDPQAKTPEEKIQGAEYVKTTLVQNLLSRKFKLPTGKGQETVEVTAKQLGITCPVIVMTADSKLENESVEDSDARHAADAVRAKAGTGTGSEPIVLKRFRFTVQFVWRPVPPSQWQVGQKKGDKSAPPGGAATAATF